jgi:hypothetical protein
MRTDKLFKNRAASPVQDITMIFTYSEVQPSTSCCFLSAARDKRLKTQTQRREPSRRRYPWAAAKSPFGGASGWPSTDEEARAVWRTRDLYINLISMPGLTRGYAHLFQSHQHGALGTVPTSEQGTQTCRCRPFAECRRGYLGA